MIRFMLTTLHELIHLLVILNDVDCDCTSHEATKYKSVPHALVLDMHEQVKCAALVVVSHIIPC